MVEWDPLFGVIPPLNDAQWHEVFDRYRQFPEYRQLRQGMSLAEFKFIFFWEYIHRVIARTIGMVFALPLVFFAARGYLNRPLALRAIALFALGGMQGVMGWLMVQSGLVDRPSVSHFRLAAHLSLAFLIFGYALWLARELRMTPDRPAVPSSTHRLLRRGLAAVGVLLALQIVWGAFVAGLKAGFMLNTFPLMAGGLLPPDLLRLEPALLNFVQNPIAVQWSHRLLGTLLGLAAIGLFFAVRRAPADAHSQRLNGVLLALIVVQYALGVLTLIRFVPVSLAVTHQATALIVFGAWLWWVHHVRNLRTIG
jgi:cytochrome c oxidase assembly protein subunit 15